MDFKSLSRLNDTINILSGNLLPVSSDKSKTPAVLKIYSILVWLIGIVYLSVCICGVFHVSKEKALQNSTVNIIVSLEIVLLLVYLNARKNLLRGLIEKLNCLLKVDNETLRNAVIKTVKPLEKPLKIYVIGAVSSVVIWTAMPLVKVLQKNEFYYEDYALPATLSKEPFPTSIFVAGILLQMLGSGYTILKKTSLDIYTMHLILLLTAQYRYLKLEFAEILRGSGRDNFENFHYGYCGCENSSSLNDKLVRRKLCVLISHHGIVVKIAVMLRKLLSINVGLLYVNNVFRFCFLGYMIITISSGFFEKSVVLMYSIGAVVQLYILCHCIQQLFEASTKLTDDAFHEKWYAYSIEIQHLLSKMILANKLQCKLSSYRNVDLTLSSFMSILNQSYSACLLFLKVN